MFFEQDFPAAFRPSSFGQSHKSSLRRCRARSATLQSTPAVKQQKGEGELPIFCTLPNEYQVNKSRQSQSPTQFATSHDIFQRKHQLIHATMTRHAVGPLQAQTHESQPPRTSQSANKHVTETMEVGPTQKPTPGLVLPPLSLPQHPRPRHSAVRQTSRLQPYCRAQFEACPGALPWASC